MKTIKLCGKSVEIYDAIEELPILRFHKYNKLLLIDAGIGSDLSDFDRHIEKIKIYMGQNKIDLADVELENMRQNIYFIQSGISPRHMAFAVLIKSIDGKPCDDISDDGLKKTMEIFGMEKQIKIATEMDAVKKKIDQELRMYFPAMFDDSESKSYYDKLRQRTLLVLHTIINGHATADDQKEIENITNELIVYFNPQTFIGQKSMEIKYDKQFEKMCLLISQNLHVNPKKYTVLEYYNAFEYLKEEVRKAEKGRKGK